MQRISLGAHLPITGFREKTQIREKILLFTKRAEDLGYESLNVHDHIVGSKVVEKTQWLDPLSVLTAASAVTDKIRLGTSVLNIVLRDPVLCAQAFASIDILSSGRLLAAGVGPGSHPEDYNICGIPFEERWPRFTKALDVLQMVWKGEERESSLSSESYKYYGAKKVHLDIRPFQNPPPPIMIGSWGVSQAGLKRVAKYGDGWMASALTVTPEEFKEKWNMLLDYRRRLGRDTESFKNSLVTVLGYIDDDEEKVSSVAANVSSPLAERSREDLDRSLLFGSREQCYRRIKAFYEAGVQSVCFWPIKNYINQIELFIKEIGRYI